MRRLYFGPPRWNLLPPEPINKSRFRGWNIIIILILALLVLGVYVAAEGSQFENNGVALTGKNASRLVVSR
jgi:hypothetical protein